MNEPQLENSERATDSAATEQGSPEKVSPRRRRARIPPLVAVERAHSLPLPLSFPQERLWFLEQLGLVGTAYNMPFALRLDGELNISALERSFAELLRRHESLRSRFVIVEGAPAQVIDPPGQFSLSVRDLTDLPEQDKSLVWRRLSREEAQRPFDLRQSPLLRAAILKIGPREHILLLTIHHIAADGWSLGILYRELGTLYGAFSQGLQSPLADLTIQYADYATWQRSWLSAGILEEQLRYWKDSLSGAPVELSLPADRPRPEVASFNGEIVTFKLPAALVRALEQLARKEQATLFMVVLAAFQLLLSRLTGQLDVVVGSAAAGRAHPLVEDLIGFFVNTLVLRTNMSGNPTFRRLLSRVREVTLGAYAHQDLPFEQLVKELHPDRNLMRQPVFQVALALQNVPQEALDLAGVKWTRLHVEQGTALFDLTLQMFEDQGGLRGELEFTLDLYERATIERLATQLRSLLEAIAADPDSSISEYSLSAPGNAPQTIGSSGTSRELGSKHDVVRLLERHAETTPDAPSVCSGDVVITYQNLNDCANGLARVMLEKGIEPGEKVGVYLGRSVEGLIAFYAILKIAAVYVPLDPIQPDERLIWMCSDAGVRYVLTLSGDDAAFDAKGVEFIEVQRQQLTDRDDAPVNVSRVAEWQSPAYAIYTSGSTGKPKGVLLHRLGLANVAAAQLSTFELRPDDRVMQFAALGFDASVFEFMLALGAGAALHLGTREELLPGSELTAFASRRSISAMVITPSALAALSPPEMQSLRVLIVAGEEFPSALARIWASRCRVFNAYGPTETTIWASTHACSAEDAVGRLPIGRPVDNTQIYIVNALMRPVALGEVGEICVGGTGIALGYINRKDLTADRFIEDLRIGPGRLYRTGDLARWRPDGAVEFIGRIDDQAKIRGYRVEPGEVEAVLQEHPAVRQAAVLVREDNPGDRRLVAYVVGNRDSTEAGYRRDSAEDLRHEIVAEWEALYERTYGDQQSNGAPSFVGWNSSFTGESIPEWEMQEWLTATVEQIRGLRPRRVLEIGCGVGLVLQRIAPQCDVYVGTDISAAALGKLRTWLQQRPDLEHVRLQQGSAMELEGFEDGSFDTVILNSVIQYFPDIKYLLDVLQRVSRLVRPAGHIFIGDVRHLGLLQTFHHAVQLFKAASSATVGELRARIAQALAREKELVIDPRFFSELSAAVPVVSAASILLKRGRASNELTRYRYDAILTIGPPADGFIRDETVTWDGEVKSLTALDLMLTSGRWKSLRVLSIPNLRLARDMAAMRLVESSHSSDEVGRLRGLLDQIHVEGVDPDDLLELPGSGGYYGAIHWADENPAYFEYRAASERDTERVRMASVHVREQPAEWSHYANDPVENGFRHHLVPALRELIKKRLPDYMIPSQWVVLSRFPLTSSGKLDRRALPAAAESSSQLVEYVSPRTGIEQLASEVWARVLRVDKVGMRDNFFELGGHSLLIVKMLQELRERGGVSAQVRDVYSCPRLDQFVEKLRAVGGEAADAASYGIPAGTREITPDMLPLIDYLEPDQIRLIGQSVPGGVENVQDIYPLAPMQEGMLFHYLLNVNGPDVYLRTMVVKLASRRTLEQFTGALRTLVNRHDVLRTAILWEQLPKPVQVVARRADLNVEILEREPDMRPLEQLMQRISSRKLRLDLRRSPLMSVEAIQDENGSQWYALLHIHHLVCDNESGQVLLQEMRALVDGRDQELPGPFQFRSHVARLLARQKGVDARRFFTDKLGDVTEPTAPFGLLDVHGDGRSIHEERCTLDRLFSARVRACARRRGVTAATLFHAVWTLVTSVTAGRSDVVYGSVLLGGLHGEIRPERALGIFINTLPLRTKLEGVTAGRLVDDTQAQLAELFEYEHVPLAVAQRCSGLGGGAPLFSSVLNFRHGEGRPEGAFKGCDDIEPISEHGRTNYPVLLSIEDQGDHFALEMETDSRVEPGRMLGYVRTALDSLIEALERDSSVLALSLRVLPEEERREVIEGFNPREAHPRVQLIHEMFEAQARLRPDAVAVSFQGQSLTYAELNVRANQLAWYLIEQGVGPDRLVGLCVERGLEMVVGLLGILKAGGAYVPLDPVYPPQRLAYMLEDAAPMMVLTQERLKDLLAVTSAKVVAMDGDWKTIARNAARNPAAGSFGLNSDHLAYVIYTSGSTGNPKGVMVAHRNVVRLFTTTERWFGFGERDVWTLFHSFAFDFSVWELWGALLYGGRLEIVPQPITRCARDFYRLLCEQGVTVLNQTPSAFAQLIEAQSLCTDLTHALRVVIFGGEALEFRTLRPWVARNGVERPELVNMYGITETTVHVTYRRLLREEIESEHGSIVGRPIPDLQTYLLDRRGDPVPIGVAGEIYVGGAGVARGYLNRPELTAERFLPDPFSVDLNARMYRSGDLGRWRSDGTIEYLGRNDEQVKIRGFRIELGEVEAQLAAHPGVREAVVTASEDGPGDRRLVAYVIPEDSSDPPRAELLREHLKGILPEYMVPGAFVTLDRLPLTAHGKLDRRALPAPGPSSYARRDYEPPKGDAEEVLAKIWQELLKMERVGRSDNFFELGGHSLLIVQMLERLRRRGLCVEVRQVFERPTLAELAATASREALEDIEVPPTLIPAGCEEITPQMLSLVKLEREQIERIVKTVPGGARNIQDIYPLTPMQEGMLFHHLLGEHGADAYERPMLLTVPSRDQLEHLIVALQAAIDRHDILRTAIRWQESAQPIQVVLRKATLRVDEITLDAGREVEEQLDEWIKADRQRMDLHRAPLIRLQIARHPTGTGWYALLLTHHLVCDNQSLDILLTEVVSYIRAPDLELAPPPPYRNHVSQVLLHARMRDSAAFFRSQLQGIDEPSAPFGLLNIHGDGTNIKVAEERIEWMLSKRLRQQARRLAVTPAAVFHAAWALVVACTTGRDDVVFGTVLLGRMLGGAGGQRILGMFINTLPLRVTLQRESAQTLIRVVQRHMVEILHHEHSSLAAAQQCSSLPSNVPLFSSLFNYRGSTSTQENILDNLTELKVIRSIGRTNYPITISVDDLGDRFLITAQTDDRVNPDRMLRYLGTALGSLVSALETAPETIAMTLQVLPEQERDQVINAFNATEADYQQDNLVHQIFEQQVELAPTTVALECNGHSLTYATLNERANRLAWYLRARGVGPDHPVGICMDRSPEMLVALLGILKAGGAYLPLDPAYPAERLAYILGDAAPQVVVSRGPLLTKLPSCPGGVIDIDGEWSEISRCSPQNLPIEKHGLNSAHLAYVIYTSGSTGQPKGVMVEHRNVVGLWSGLEELYARSGDCRRVAVNAPLTFDSSVKQLVQLLSGRTLILIPEEDRRDSWLLLKTLADAGVESVDCTPSQLKAWVAANLLDRVVPSLRMVLVGGEAIDPELWNKLAACTEMHFLNVYGPTECTVDVTTADIDAFVSKSHIGRPMENRRVYILNHYGQPVPVGVPGEICIGGAGVGRGYLNSPGLTAERFVTDPFRAAPNERMYRSGDLGQWRPDGTIEYLGRNDSQVKIRGHRIELGEIEASLAKHPSIKEAAVAARSSDAGHSRLVAYVVAHDACSPPRAEDLVQYLERVVPGYMIPSTYVLLDKLPITPNGKLDRRSLPEPEPGAWANRRYEPPQGAVEMKLAGIWEDLLRLKPLGRDDNFFTLGGHSLSAMQMIAKVTDLLGVRLPLSALYQNSTLKQLAALVVTTQGDRTDDSPIEGMAFDELVIRRDPGEHRTAQ